MCNQINKDNKFWDKFFKSVNATYGSLSAMLIVMLILCVIGKVEDIALRADLLLLSFALYYEGANKVGSYDIIDRSAWLTVGKLGSIFSAVLATIKILQGYSVISPDDLLIKQGPIQTIQIALVFVAITYVIGVNYVGLGLSKNTTLNE